MSTHGDTRPLLARSGRLPLVVPPPGPFSLMSLHKAGSLLKVARPPGWVGVRFASGRIGSFMTGEKKLAGTNTPPRVGGRHATGGEGVRHACQRGPQRAPAAKPAAAESQEAEGEPRRRGRAILHGDDPEPLKVDCPYCPLRVRSYDAQCCSRWSRLRCHVSRVFWPR